MDLLFIFCPVVLISSKSFQWFSNPSLLGKAAGTAIHSISPSAVSLGGGVIYIYGSGFAGDNFNFDDPILGNKIWFYNDFETLVCISPVDKNWLLQNPQVKIEE